MKKISILLCLSFLFLSKTVYAEEDCKASCKIKDGPAPAITQYLNDVRKLTAEVNSQALKNAPSPSSTSSFFKTRGKLVGAFSRLMSWEGYDSTFNFYVVLPITQAVPPAVKRDHSLLENEIKRQRRILENLLKRGAQDSTITDACKGLDENVCNFKNATAQQILTETIKSTQKISEYIRVSVLGNADEFEGIEEMILVQDNFFDQLGEYYNPFTLEDCTSCKGAFSERVRTGMKNIIEFNKLGKNGIQRWVDAWNLLIGNTSTAKYQQVERQVLARELGRQGLSMEQSQIILNNLQRYNNEGGYSLSNNFVVNTFNPPAKQLGKLVNDFNGAVEKAYNRYGGESIPIVEFAKIAEQINKSSGIQKDILVFYQTFIPLANAQDTSAEQLIGRIVQYHQNLTEIINELDKLIPISEKVCGDQDENRGKCKYR